MPGVVYFEIHADNPERAAAFYCSVFGQKIKKWEEPFDYCEGRFESRVLE